MFSNYLQFYNRQFIYYCNKKYTPLTEYKFYKFIIITLSNPCNVKNRYSQREYRKKHKRNILFVYVIGYSDCDSILYYEYLLYRDILFLNIKNHYFNITNVFLEVIIWINIKFSYDYIIKWDDDIIVNIPLLQIYFNLQKKLLHYIGYSYNNTKICRNRSKICFVPFSIYHYSYLPSFVASGLMIISKNTSNKIDYYHKIYKSYVIRDDQYVGILCNKLSIKPISINKYYVRKANSNKNYNINYLLAYHANSYYELKRMMNSN